jgi:hypothetical protein
MPNFYCIFGCAPEGGVAIDSTLAKSLSEHIKIKLSKQNGIFRLPEGLNGFKKNFNAQVNYRNDATQNLWLDVKIKGVKNADAPI